MLNARVSIPLANAILLSATPYQLLPAPPVGYAYDVFDVVVVSNNAATALTGGSSQHVGFTSAPATYPLGTVLLSNLTGGLKWTTNMPASGTVRTNFAQANALGQSVFVGGGGAELAGGDSPVVFTIFYTLVAMP